MGFKFKCVDGCDTNAFVKHLRSMHLVHGDFRRKSKLRQAVNLPRASLQGRFRLRVLEAPEASPKSHLH